MTYGNYRRLHYTEAVAEAEERGEILVGLDEVLTCSSGEGVVAIHIVAAPDFWTMDEPQAYGVELVRPRWLYGSEGILFPVRWVGRAYETTIAELDELGKLSTEELDASPYGQLPDNDNHLWAIPKVPKFSKQPWKRCELQWWRAFREA
ncbi:hypothetical protein [Mycolicibacterium septicum]|uniref:hypothetical protein n=1 Tax=Mycolicibacterium septicum TaxID=98668 RepID=UPI001AF8304F|nr:hypothetical protein [Mycolicibacterium septicum]QRY51791.1 hypothetical protein JVX95_31195 [Mycolicibacterium septicum]